MELNNEFRVAVPAAVAWGVLTDVERIAPCMPGAQLQEVEGDEYRGVVKVKVGPITAQYKGKATFLERDEPAGRIVLRAEGRDTRGQGNASANITASLEPDGDGTKVRVVTDLTVTGKVAQFGRGVLAEVSAKLLNQFVECLHRDVLEAAGLGEAADAAAPPAAAGDGQSLETVSGVNEERAAAAVPVGADAGTGAAAQEAAPAAAAVEVEVEPAPAPGRPEEVEAESAVAAVVIEAGAVPPADIRPAGAGANGSVPDEDTAAPAGVRRIDHPEPAPVDLIDAAGASVARRALPLVAGVFVVVLVVVRRRRRAARRA